MKKEIRTIVYDIELNVEAYHLEGIVQPFPNHFHECYVIGFIEGGQRQLTCKHKTYTLHKADMIIFNPYDNHECQHIGKELLDYRAINIPQSTMLNLVKEITGQSELSSFSENVIVDREILCYLKSLHSMIMQESEEFEKQEKFILLISMLIQRYGQPFDYCLLEYSKEIDKVCLFIDEHFSEHISLYQLCQYVGLSQSTLLRAFMKSKGVTPYRYLESKRINEARKLLEEGLTPVQVALQTGFSDQSHFTNYFSRITGISPALYRDIFIKEDL